MFSEAALVGMGKRDGLGGSDEGRRKVELGTTSGPGIALPRLSISTRNTSIRCSYTGRCFVHRQGVKTAITALGLLQTAAHCVPRDCTCSCSPSIASARWPSALLFLLRNAMRRAAPAVSQDSLATLSCYLD